MIYKSFQRHSLSIDLLAGDVRCVLVGGGYVPDEEHETSEDISRHEITAEGYMQGGQSLRNKRLIENEDGEGALVADSCEWPNSSIKARGAVLVYAPTNELICHYDFGADRQSTNGMFRIQWDRMGIISTAAAVGA